MLLIASLTSSQFGPISCTRTTRACNREEIKENLQTQEWEKLNKIFFLNVRKRGWGDMRWQRNYRRPGLRKVTMDSQSQAAQQISKNKKNGYITNILTKSQEENLQAHENLRSCQNYLQWFSFTASISATNNFNEFTLIGHVTHLRSSWRRNRAIHCRYVVKCIVMCQFHCLWLLGNMLGIQTLRKRQLNV